MLATNLSQALGLILHGPSKTENAEIVLLDYRDPATFSALWFHGLQSGDLEIDGETINLSDSTKQFLLIGIDPPDGTFDTKIPALSGINFRSHFTATSWLAAWKVKFPDAHAHIAIIDLREAGAGSGAARALQTILAARDCLGRPLAAHASIFNAPGLEAICHWLSTADTDDYITAAFVPDLLRSIIWNGLTGNPEDHHSISNILGAALLGAGENEWIGFSFLFRLVSTLGLKLPAKGDLNSRVALPDSNLGFSERCLLFDDLQRLWRQPLLRLFESCGMDHDPGASGKCNASIDLETPYTGDLDSGGIRTLVDNLERLVDQPYERRFLTMGDFGVEGGKANECEFILFLDLRLFGPSTSPREEERRLFEKLYDLHMRLLKSATDTRARARLPWISRIGDDVLDGLTGQNGFVQGYRKARALLPKLISLIDPTLPIVVFSSTQDGEVLRQLSSHGNIITCFSKPVFRGAVGDWDEWFAAIQLNFAAALRDASAILKVRRDFLRLEPSASCGSPSTSEQSPDGEPKKAVSVEIFWDESGEAHQTPFGIGGLVLISWHPNGFDHKQFTDALAAENMLWGASAERLYRSRDQFPREFASKGELLETGVKRESNGLQTDQNASLGLKFSSIQNACSSANGEVYAFAFINEENSSADFRSPRHPHHRYRELIRDLLEGLLFHFAPVVNALNGGAWLSVDAATWSPAWKREWGDFAEAKRTLGIEDESRNTGRYSAFARSDLLPLLLDVINRSGVQCDWKNRIRRARAVQLVDFANRNDLSHALYNMDQCPPHQVHYLADWIAHLATQLDHRGEIPKIILLKDWFERGWLQRISAEFRLALRSIRYWRQGRELEAVRSYPSNLTPDLGWPYSLRTAFANEVATWHQRIGGERLSYLFSATRSFGTLA